MLNHLLKRAKLADTSAMTTSSRPPSAISATCLSVLLYLGPPFGRNCYLEERGYLVCFCPVLFVDWWMACCFAFSSVVYIHRNDLMWLVGRGPARDPQATSEPGDSLI